MLHGRERELADVRRLLDRARSGRSAALLLRGAPGSGKSALLDEIADLAPDSVRVLRGVGIESESELPFASLHLLLRPVQDRIDGLPEPQAAALRHALGLSSIGAADRFLVGLAVLTLLSDLAEASPVLGIVDDVQWVDRASAEALFFVARRLRAEGVVLLFAARENFEAHGISHRNLAGLNRSDALAVLAERKPGLAPHVRERIIAEAGGNPLALIELPGTLPGPQRAPVGPLPLPRRLQQVYGGEIAALPEPTRLLLLVAAAEESGDLATILLAAERLGLPAASITPAERAGLLQVTGDVVRFRHPLIRSAAYNGLTVERRLEAHRILAGVLRDDRRAWHLAVAATGPDESAATELHAAARRAEERGGHAAAAVAYERSAELSSDESFRGVTLAAAADAAAAAGRLDQAAELARRADRVGLEPRIRARLAAIQADAEYESGRSKNAYELLMTGAELLGDSDPEDAALMLLAAIRTAYYGGVAMTEAASLTRDLVLPEAHPLQTLLAVARTVAGWRVDGSVVGPPPFEDAQAACAAMPGGLRGRLEAVHLMDLAYGRVESAETVAALITDCRAASMVGLLPQALLLLSMIELSMSHWRAGYAHADEALRITEETGQQHTAAWLRSAMAWAAAVTGDEQRCVRLVEQCMRDEPTVGIGFVGRRVLRLLCLLDIGFGRYAAALDRMDAMIGQSGGLDRHLVPERIEAATRLGQPERIGNLADMTDLIGLADDADHPVATAITLRCRAMLAGSADEADGFFREALRSHAALSWPFEHARTELLYGEWLRRARRKREARAHLRTALEAFERMGARPWADRTRRELQASGDSVERAAAPSGVDQLTPQELQIVRLAANGMTNREIAAQLFLSPKTVGHHLYRAFPKLGVATRTELARLDLD